MPEMRVLTPDHLRAGDGGPPTSALLYSPYHAVPDSSAGPGGYWIADAGNQAIRRILPIAQCGQLGSLLGCVGFNLSAIICNLTGATNRAACSSVRCATHALRFVIFPPLSRPVTCPSCVRLARTSLFEFQLCRASTAVDRIERIRLSDVSAPGLRGRRLYGHFDLDDTG